LIKSYLIFVNLTFLITYFYQDFLLKKNIPPLFFLPLSISTLLILLYCTFSKVKNILLINGAVGSSLFFTLVYFMPILQRPSCKEFAQIIKKNPQARVISFRCYPQDLPVYLNQTIIVADYLGELEFGTHIVNDDTKTWMLSKNSLREFLKINKNIFIVCRKKDLELLPYYQQMNSIKESGFLCLLHVK
jgi:hypothetical protein